MIILEVINIRVLNYNIKFEARFSLYINYFLYNYFEVFGLLILLFYLNFNREFQTCLEIVDNNRLIESFNKIEIYQNRLEILKIGCLILSFF